MIRRSSLVVAALLATLLLARTADAAPPTREMVSAQQWFAHGLASVRAGDLAGARRAFGAAYALVPSIDILWNLATTERKLGDGVAALEHLRIYVASPDARADRKQIASEEMLPELEASVAHLSLSEPEGTVVIVDGRPVPPTTTLDLSPGVHALVIHRDGETQTLAVNTPPGTVTTIPTEPQSLSHVPVPVPVPVPALPLALSRAPAPTDNRTLAILSLGGAAALSIAGGVYFSLSAADSQSTADRLEAQMHNDYLTCKRAGTVCDDYQNARASAQRSSLLGTSLLVGGGVLGGAAVAAWVLWPSSATRVTPIATKDTAGVTMTGRF